MCPTTPSYTYMEAWQARARRCLPVLSAQSEKSPPLCFECLWGLLFLLEMVSQERGPAGQPVSHFQGQACPIPPTDLREREVQCSMQKHAGGRQASHPSLSVWGTFLLGPTCQNASPSSPSPPPPGSPSSHCLFLFQFPHR